MSFRHLRNVRGFFSDYYLASVFGREGGKRRKEKLADKVSDAAYQRLLRLYDRLPGRDLPTSECRERFLRPVLREVFGFLLGEGEGRLYPLVPVSTCADDLAEASPAVAVAWLGGIDEDLDTPRGGRSPRKDLELALVRSGHRYGLLATGERLRLLRAPGEGPAGSYLEIDLAGLAADPEPESFAVALKLLAPENFLPDTSGEMPIDAIEQESRRHAEKVSEDLKAAVFRAAESLVGGLLADAARRGEITDPAVLARLELGTYRDAALLAIYRLLFILYAEDRDPRLDENPIYTSSYSARTLVQLLAEDPLRQWGHDRWGLWARLLALFAIYDRGMPPIDRWQHIPPRGGDFFSSESPEGGVLANARLPDATVARLLLDLATTQPRVGIGRELVSFRELDIESLGAVYEGLLEQEPRVAAGPTLEVRVQGRSFVLAPEEVARLCDIKQLRLSGPTEWVEGTAAAAHHPDAEAEEDGEEEDTEDDDGDGEREQDDEDSESGEAEAGAGDEKPLKKGAVAKLVRRLERGDFHFVAGLGRKGSGSFYTPRPLVRDLIEHALGPVAIGRSSSEIEALRVLDPACGSGHFLVEAMRFLGRELHRAYVREHGRESPSGFRATAGSWDTECDASDEAARAAASEARAWCKRRVAERCLFGVDLNPTAVTLARVALWIESAAGDRPLTYFDHHVRTGNSLLGTWRERLDAPPLAKGDQAQRDAFAQHVRDQLAAATGELADELGEAGHLRRLIDAATAADLAREGIEPESLEEQRYKEGLRQQAAAVLAGARLLFDLRSAALFVPEIQRDWAGLVRHLADPQALEAACRARRWWSAFDEIRQRYRFFHWELEFPEVFLAAERPGFHAVLGNPPWDKVLPERQAFFGRVDSLIRAFKGSDLDARVRELQQLHPGLEEDFERFQTETRRFAEYLRGSGDFPYAEARSQAAHEDLSKYFLDRAARLAADGGAVGFLVPSVVYNGDGCVGLRRFLLGETRIERFYGFENRGKLFPTIDSRYKFVNLVFRKGAPPAPFTAAFMRQESKELDEPGPKPWEVTLTREEIERYSPDTFAFLEYRDRRDQEIVAKMYEGAVRLEAGEEEPGSWEVTLFTDFAHILTYNTTRDKDLWTDPHNGRLYTPRSVLGFAPPSAEETIERMRLAGYWPVFEGKHVDQYLVGIKPIRWWLSAAAAERKYGKPPRQVPTLVFRETARNTDERTCIAVVLPARSVASHTLSGAIPSSVSPETAAAVLNSLCFDYALRLRTAGTHISFTYLRPMPVPAAEVVRNLPTLPTHSAWRAGTRHITDHTDLWPRLWQLNRAVAEAYGLGPADLAHILESFPVMARKRRELVDFFRDQIVEWSQEVGDLRKVI